MILGEIVLFYSSFREKLEDLINICDWEKANKFLSYHDFLFLSTILILKKSGCVTVLLKR